MPVDILRCSIQRYPWGSTTAIPAILGLDPDGAPQAELWAGAHPSAPSLVDGRSLADVIADDPVAALGEDVLQRFGPRLPFLAKILAAAEPLSIQAHPDLARARKRFAEEEGAGIAIDARERTYKDANHKPEMLVALTPFSALTGFRPPHETMALLEELDLAALAPFAQLVAEGPAAVVATLLGNASVGREVAARAAEGAAAQLAASGWSDGGPPPVATDPVRALAWWTDRIAHLHPDDPGIGVALLLNLVDLEPGEAVNLRAGNLHAYLAGTGIEVMASSDNVLRGGLTAKHIDVQELLAVLDPAAGPPPVVAPERTGRIVRWPAPDPDFAMSMVDAGTDEVVVDAGPRVAIVVDGEVRLGVGDAGGTLVAPSGSVVWVPAADGPLRIYGDGRTFVATVGP
jgi:mannose-6-phosphate isomerase